METKQIRTMLVGAIAIVLLCGAIVHGQTKGSVQISLDDILLAHGASKVWVNAPQSIRITGTSAHDNTLEPVTLTATGKEESAVTYGSIDSRKLVATSKTFFKDNGSKSVKQPTPAGFTQLDVTGLFLIEELKTRPFKIGFGEPVSPAGPRPIYRVHVLNDTRSEMHYARLKVADEMDLFVSEAGLLLGIERTFYAQSPIFKSALRYAFSDFRETGGVLLPYQIDKSVNGIIVETIRVASYAFDVTIPPTLFEARRAK